MTSSMFPHRMLQFDSALPAGESKATYLCEKDPFPSMVSGTEPKFCFVKPVIYVDNTLEFCLV